MIVGMMISVSGLLMAQENSRFARSNSASPEDLAPRGEVLVTQVRVQIVSYDTETGEGIGRLSGDGCEMCDSDYRLIADATRLKTSSYEGNLDIASLRQLSLAKADVLILADSKIITLISYVPQPF